MNDTESSIVAVIQNFRNSYDDSDNNSGKLYSNFKYTHFTDALP
jgi:hypothetical protein